MHCRRPSPGKMKPTRARHARLRSVTHASPTLKLQAVYPVRTWSAVQCRSNCTHALLQLALPHKSKLAIAHYFTAHKTELESTDEDDLPQQAAHAPHGRGWSRKDVATLKRGMQMWGHQWAKIQVGMLLRFVTARCLAVSGVGLLLGLLLGLIIARCMAASGVGLLLGLLLGFIKPRCMDASGGACLMVRALQVLGRPWAQIQTGLKLGLSEDDGLQAHGRQCIARQEPGLRPGYSCGWARCPRAPRTLAGVVVAFSPNGRECSAGESAAGQGQEGTKTGGWLGCS